MPNEVKLLPCPFCGGEAVHVLQRWGGRKFHSVKCGDCLIWQDSRSGSEESAALAWNTRPTIVTDEDVERVAEALWRAEWAEGHEPAHSWDAMCSEDWDIAEAFRAQARAAIAAMPAIVGGEGRGS